MSHQKFLQYKKMDREEEHTLPKNSGCHWAFPKWIRVY